MPYWQLKSIADDQRQYIATMRVLPPVACPICGQPLDIGWSSDAVGVDGKTTKSMLRHCDMGHFTWQGGENPMV